MSVIFAGGGAAGGRKFVCDERKMAAGHVNVAKRCRPGHLKFRQSSNNNSGGNNNGNEL